MPITKKSSFRDETMALPIVHIDAMDLSMAIPLREYFVANGCRVLVNTDTKESVFYHIIIGDHVFVKSFIDTPRIRGKKTLFLCWTFAIENGFIDTLDNEQKLAFIDPKQMTQSELNEILKFFFTGRTKTKNFQSILRSQSQTHFKQDTQETYKRPKPRENADQIIHTTDQDRARIKQTIEKEFPAVKKIRNNNDKERVSKGRLIVSGVIMFLSFCVFILIVFFLSIASTGFALYQGTQCMKNEDVSCVTTWMKISQSSVNMSTNLFVYIDIPHKFIQGITHKTISVSTYERLFTLFNRLISIEGQANGLLKDSQLFLTAFFPTTTQDSDTTTVVQMENMKTQLFLLQSDLDMTYLMAQDVANARTFPFSLPQSKKLIQTARAKLDQIRSTIATVQRLSLLYPYISGFKDKQSYLILLQNSTELRPTGGFIGSFMKLSVSDGKIDDMNVQDIYTIDGQLKGHVDPPEPIGTLLNQEHWYLRDSNWSPDFSQSAQKALWFYEKETGESPQGVIAVNSSIITKLLQITGPIKLSDFNDEITVGNFYAKSMYYTQTNFFPGSTQKKDFLGALLTEMMNRIFEKKSVSKTQLFSVIESSLEDRDIQFYFTSPEAQQIVDQFHWSGIIPTKKLCTDPLPNGIDCIPDYLSIFESNMGVNKANFFIKREQTRDITIDGKGNISETMTRTFTNVSQGETGSGTYRNYMRILIPKNAHVSAFTINDIPIPANTNKKGAPIELPYGEIDTETFDDYATFAVAFDTPAGSNTSIRITYSQPTQTKSDIQPPRFEFLDQNQSGISDMSTRIRIHYPTLWGIKQDAHSLSPSLANDGYLEYNSTMSHDINLEIQFIQKGISL